MTRTPTAAGTLLAALACALPVACLTPRQPPLSPTRAGIDTIDLIDPAAQAEADRLLSSTDIYRLAEGVRRREPPAPGANRTVLCLSGGGSYGAYSAGVLVGWSSTCTRPRFDVVTGISTGALIAPFAFLGPRLRPARREVLHVGREPRPVPRPAAVRAAVRSRGRQLPAGATGHGPAQPAGRRRGRGRTREGSAAVRRHDRAGEPAVRRLGPGGDRGEGDRGGPAAVPARWCWGRRRSRGSSRRSASRSGSTANGSSSGTWTAACRRRCSFARRSCRRTAPTRRRGRWPAPTCTRSSPARCTRTRTRRGRGRWTWPARAPRRSSTPRPAATW